MILFRARDIALGEGWPDEEWIAKQIPEKRGRHCASVGKVVPLANTACYNLSATVCEPCRPTRAVPAFPSSPFDLVRRDILACAVLAMRCRR